MLRTAVRRAHIHKPGFRFPDRRTPKEPHSPHPHPAAPESVVKNFAHFQKLLESGPHFDPSKLQATVDNVSSNHGNLSISMQGREVASDIHLLPERFWKTPALAFGDDEIEVVMSGGAR